MRAGFDPIASPRRTVAQAQKTCRWRQSTLYLRSIRRFANRDDPRRWRRQGRGLLIVPAQVEEMSPLMVQALEGRNSVEVSRS